MRPFKYILPATILMLLAYPARGQAPEKILAKIDSVQNAFSDMSATQHMILIDENGRKKERVVEIRQKGTELRMVRFLEPADVRGIGFLRLASDRLYLYLPAFRRVRRIASSATNENFMGTDFTYEDMSQSRYSDDYKAEKISNQNGQFTLTILPKPGSDVSYGKLILVADSDTYVLRKVEYFGEREHYFKQLTYEDIQRIDGYWMARTMRMKNLDENHETVLNLSNIRFDQGLSDSEFSERSLKRPVR